MIEAITSKQNFKSIIKDLTVKDFDPLCKAIFGSFGIQSNPYITENEFRHTLNTL
jgi:hypothetical protein